MDNIIWGVAALLGVVFILFILFVIGLTWEFAIRSAYFAGAAKWYGWSEEEKFKRDVARGLRKIGKGRGKSATRACYATIVFGDDFSDRHGCD